MVLTGFLVLLLAGFFQGSFGLGMKEYKPLSWEAFWSLFSIIAMVCIPLIWTYIEVPNFFEYISATPSSTLFKGAFCGLFWGITAIGFGKAIDLIGMSLTYGIAMGVSAAVGALFPLFSIGNKANSSFFTFLIIGIIVMLLGVAVITKAGIMKDSQATAGDSGNKTSNSTLGLILAFISGLGSAAQNIGFTYAGVVSGLAVQNGENPTSASLIAWIVVFAGGFIANFGYAIYLLAKNKTFNTLSGEGCEKGYLKVLITSFMWYAALATYGKATVLLGTLGPVVGWIAFMALALVISNGWGIKTGEWDNTGKAKQVLYVGNLILIISWIIVGYSNTLI